MRTRRQPRNRVPQVTKQGKVRRRLLGTLLVCVATLLAASAPGVAVAVSDLDQAQTEVRLADLQVRAVSLAHSLADERDEMAVFVAGGRSAPRTLGPPMPKAWGVSESQRSRVDRQVGEVSGAAADAGAAADVRELLTTLPQVRQRALTGEGDAQDVLASYTVLIDALNRVGGLPVPPLARAAEAASAARGLLVSALTAKGSQRTLTAAAQTAWVREKAAVTDFQATASHGARVQYDQTVTGADVAEAERDLQRLTDASNLSSSDRSLGAAHVGSALTARIGLMRTVESSLATAEAARLAAERDDAVTALELRVALAAACLLLSAGIVVSTARSVTRPLTALHRFARGKADEAKVIGRDEFSVVARRINDLVEEIGALRTRARQQEAEFVELVGARDALVAAREVLLRRQEALTDQIGAARHGTDRTYINLNLRTLGLVERQLTLIEGLEDREQDPDRLETLFKLDHLATRMRRNSENLLVLTGTEHSHGPTAKPVPLVDMARAAISEVERYERVQILALPGTRIIGRAADDTSHLIAELLDNATTFSPPQAAVPLSGWMLENGDVMLSVEDRGIGIPADRLAELNALLETPAQPTPADATGMGLYVVARLAARHGIRVHLREQAQGGVTAVVVVPSGLLAAPRPDEVPTDPVEVALAGEPLPARSDGGAPAGPDTPAPADLPAAPEHGAAPGPYPSPAAAVSAAASVPGPRSGGEQSAGPGAAAPAPSWTGAAGDEDATGDAGLPLPRRADGPLPMRAPAADLVDRDVAPQHGRPADSAHATTGHRPDASTAVTPQAADAGPAVPSGERGLTGLTAKGLPQRVPRSTGLSGEPARRSRPANGPVDAEALRRKFGGLQRGLRDGRRVVEQETVDGAPTPQDGAPGTGSRVAGTGPAAAASRNVGDLGAAETAEEASR